MPGFARARAWAGIEERHERALRSQIKVLGALFFREAESRHGRAFALGYLVAGIEPLLIALILGVLFEVLSRSIPYGRNLMLFLGTGVFPVYLFIHSSMRMRQPLSLGRNRVRFPQERPLDHILVHALLHFLTSATVACMFFGGLYLSGVRAAIPNEPAVAIEALGAIYLLGMGAGIINAVIARLFPVWDIVWPALARAELHFSGLFFVVAFLPPHIRWYFALNPLAHGIDWFRHAFYPFYPDLVTDRSYILTLIPILFTLGLLLDASTRQYLEKRE